HVAIETLGAVERDAAAGQAALGGVLVAGQVVGARAGVHVADAARVRVADARNFDVAVAGRGGAGRGAGVVVRVHADPGVEAARGRGALGRVAGRALVRAAVPSEALAAAALGVAGARPGVDLLLANRRVQPGVAEVAHRATRALGAGDRAGRTRRI